MSLKKTRFKTNTIILEKSFHFCFFVLRLFIFTEILIKEKILDFNQDRNHNLTFGVLSTKPRYSSVRVLQITAVYTGSLVEGGSNIFIRF